MKFKEYAAIGILLTTIVAIVSFNYLIPTGKSVITDNKALPNEADQKDIFKDSIQLMKSLSEVSASSDNLEKTVDKDTQIYQQIKLTSQIIEHAKQKLFAGMHKNGQPFFLKSTSDNPITAKDAHQVKEILMQAGAEYFSLREEDNLVMIEAKIDDLQNIYYTYQQIYKGAPVEGGVLVVQTDSNDSVNLVTGQFESQLNVDLEQLQDAMQATTNVLKSIADTSTFTPIVHVDPELRIFLTQPSNEAIAAYRSVVEYNDSDGINHLDELFVDAQQAHLIKVYSLIHTALDRQIYSTRNNYCIGTPGIPESYTLPGSYKFGESGPGYSADVEEKSAYDNTGSSYWFFKHMFNRDSYDGKGVRLRSSVHSLFMTPQYNCTGNNAQYRPAPYDQLIFGTGDNGPGLAQSLDVVGHELTHGVTHNTSGLKYEKETGAINEAISDIFGAGIEAWTASGGNKSTNPVNISTNSNTWIVCSQCASNLKRYMSNPTQDNQSKDYYPEKYSGTEDNGGVHLNSGIINLAFYLLSEGGKHPRNKTSVAVNGIGIEKALKIYHDANTQLFKTLTNTSNAFTSARNLLAQAAETRYGKCSSEWSSVHASFRAVGVGAAAPSCNNIEPTNPTQPPAPIPEPPSENFALDARAYASSYYRYGYEPLRMNDAQLNTQWRSRQIFSPYQAEVAVLDFGKVIDFNNITIDWSGNDYPRYFYIQKLDTNNYWRTVETVSKSSSGPTSLNVSGNTKMLRIVMKHGSYYRWFAIKELKVN